MFIKPFNFSFFSVTGWSIDLDNCDIIWFALETNRDHFVIFETASKYCISVKIGHGKTDWFQIGKGVRQGCILSPCLFNFYVEYIMRNARLEEAQAESRLLGEISIISDMQMTPPLWQKAKRN